MYHRLVCKLFVAAAAVAILAAHGVGPARAADSSAMTGGGAVISDNIIRTVKLGLNKSLVIDLPRDARDVLVSNPTIADAVIRTSRRIYLTGNKGGQTNIVVFDRNGGQIANLDVQVQEDTASLQAMINRLIPGASVVAEYATGNIILTGSVRTAIDAKQAYDIADAFLGIKPGAGSTTTNTSSSGATTSDPNANGGNTAATSDASTSTSGPAGGPRVINLLTIEGQDQVQIKVSVVEVQRNIAKQLGVDLSGSFNAGIAYGQTNLFQGKVPGEVNVYPFGVSNNPPTGYTQLGFQSGNNSLTATLRALDRTSLIRTLAEPTLTAISGESASFLAGGEFPVPTGKDKDGNVTINFKPFGVSLSFTPVVLSEGRISLHVRTEVSDLSTENSVAIAGLNIPAIVVRRSETVMELPSGGSMVMGGMMQDNVKQAISGFPGLKKLPVLGALFRSRDYIRNETELVIIVTPYLVKPVARTALARPDDGFNPPNDASADFLGRLNRVYGTQGQPAPAGTYKGRYGFIYE